jgi:phospholipid transport system transporter-binding protein
MNAEAAERAAEASVMVVLPARFTIVEVANIKHKLEAALDSGKSIQLDASRVERVDTAALQLLLAFWRVAPDEGVGITWLSPTPPLISAARELGLLTYLKLA